MSKIYVIEWWVDYESDYEDQNVHEVREVQKRVHESTKSMFAQKKAELGL